MDRFYKKQTHGQPLIGDSFEMIPREYALGKTAGETYAEGITTIGIKYIFEKNEERTWWWDGAENVVLILILEYGLQVQNIVIKIIGRVKI